MSRRLWFRPTSVPVGSRKIREAIDLVQLLLAVKPSAIRHVLLRTTEPWEQVDRRRYSEELKAMARGVPLELRVQLTYQSMQLSHLRSQFLSLLMQKGDESFSNHELFQTRRQELLDKLFDRPATLKRFAHCALNTAIRAELVIDTMEAKNVDELESEAMLESVRAFLVDLDVCQSRRATQKWKIVTKHAPFRIEKIGLRLRRLHITPHVVQSAKALMTTGIPVDVSRLNLDFRLVSCGVKDLHAFVQAIATDSSELIIDTGTMFNHSHEVAADAQGQDQRQRVRMVMRAIASTAILHGVNLTEILKLCTTPRNREAVWRGLFEDILSRDVRLERLIFYSDVIFTEQDAVCIAQCATRWREAVSNSGKKQLVRHLQIDLEDSDSAAVRALISAFDDIETLSLSIFFADGAPDDFVPIDVASILRFASLRSLTLHGVDIPTMDLFDPSNPDPQLPAKPTLRKLDLRRVEIDDPESLPRFLHQLKHTTATPSGLARSLRVFRIVQNGIDRPRFFHCKTLAVLDEMLVTNNTLTEVTVSVDPDEPEAFNLAQQLLHKHTRRAIVAEKVSDIAKARNAAFLSVIGGRAAGSVAQLDSTLVRQILVFSASHEERKMSNEP